MHGANFAGLPRLASAHSKRSAPPTLVNVKVAVCFARLTLTFDNRVSMAGGVATGGEVATGGAGDDDGSAVGVGDAVGLAVKVAVTLVASVIGTKHELRLPEQPPPDQPAKVEPSSGRAWSSMTHPWGYSDEHWAPQSIPRPSKTSPEPVPFFVIVRTRGITKNTSRVTDALSVSVQVGLSRFSTCSGQGTPKSKPQNFEPSAAVAVSVTFVPLWNVAVQTAPQSLPAGALVIVPAPDPAFATVRVWRVANVAVSVTSPDSVMLHQRVGTAPQPPPDQPTNSLPGAALAFTQESIRQVSPSSMNTIAVPVATVAAQVAPQSIPPGPVTVPSPAPVLATVKVPTRTNLTTSAVSASMTTGHVVSAPQGPETADPESGVMDSVTVVPASKRAKQTAVQSIPAGQLTILPLPVPASPPLWTVSW